MESEAPVMFQGVAKQSAAFRLMQQMGWEEGSGLGKDLQGMKSHIRVSKKSDTSGIGLDAKAKAQANWALNTRAYDSILKNLKVQVAVKPTKDNGDESSSDEDEDYDNKDEVTQVVGEVAEEVKPRKVARPQGRYKKREQGKMVGAYSAIDLAAILGAVAGKNELEPFSKELTNLEVDKVVPAIELESSRAPVLKKVSKKMPKKKTGNNVEKDKENDYDDSASIPLPPLPADWWGKKYGFVRAGHLGAQRDPPKVRTGDENATASSRTSFREQDQEDLYNLVQDKATKGKKGLGIGDRAIKFEGSIWKGQKKTLDSSSEDDEEEKDDDSDAEASDRDQGAGGGDGKCKEDPKKRKCETASVNDRDSLEEQGNVEETKSRKRRKTGDEREDTGVSAKVDDDMETPSGEKGDNTPNWRKLCKQVLAESPSQTLSFKRLQKRVLAAGLFTGGAQKSVEDRMASLKQKLQKSSKFVVDGKTVSLVATKVGA